MGVLSASSELSELSFSDSLQEPEGRLLLILLRRHGLSFLSWSARGLVTTDNDPMTAKISAQMAA